MALCEPIADLADAVVPVERAEPHDARDRTRMQDSELRTEAGFAPRGDGFEKGERVLLGRDRVDPRQPRAKVLAVALGQGKQLASVVLAQCPELGGFVDAEHRL